IFGMTKEQSVAYLTARMTRPPSPSSEVQSAVEFAYKESSSGPGVSKSRMPGQSAPTPRKPLPEYDESQLRKAAARIQMPRSWRHWLWERSAIRPDSQNAVSFLAKLFEPGETVLAFDEMQARYPKWQLIIESPTMDCRVPPEMRAGGQGQGIWYLCAPVDGQWHPNPRDGGKLSCRSQEAATAFRYMVWESDEAPFSLWMAMVVQIPARIAAIYTSGGKSVHTLVRIDAASKAEFDAIREQHIRPLCKLGGDVACLSAVRLTRLPGCRRPAKGGIQQLLYLAPSAPNKRLIDLPVIQTRGDALARWRSIHPRWNKDMEAFQ
ncbi:MAG TPA: hypothetical protein P5055_03570, partial [Candidatus Paceibacterota bacterium]|nr:hypothetical protein [Candidatus Paceibacterota bacterium]